MRAPGEPSPFEEVARRQEPGARFVRFLVGVASKRSEIATSPASEDSKGLTERRRSRTDRAVGYTTAQVLKTCWATGPVPLRRAGYMRDPG